MKNVTKVIAIATVVAATSVSAFMHSNNGWGGNNMGPFSSGNNFGPFGGGSNAGPFSGAQNWGPYARRQQLVKQHRLWYTL